MDDFDLDNLFRLDGKVAIVAGASSGIGRRCARVLHASGAQVVAAARRAELLEELSAGSTGIVAVPCDVTLDEDCSALVARATERFGRVDVLVNSVGLADGGVRAEEEDADLFRRVVDVNLTSVFVLSQACARVMIEQGKGSIVNISSIHGLVASTPNRQVAYDASKGGVTLLTRELACQWARKGIRVNALAPGYVRTDLTEELFAHERGEAWIAENTPLARAAELREIDGALLLLASDAGSYITGETLVVDGGWTAR